MGINKFYNTILFILVFISSFIFISCNSINEIIKYSFQKYKSISNINYNYDGLVVKEKEKTMLILPYQNKYNIPYLVNGSYPSENNITILPSYAKLNNIKINDNIIINNNTYKVIGYAYNPLYIYPIINSDMPVFISKDNNIVYMDNNDFNSIKGLEIDHSLDDLRLNYLTNRIEYISLYSNIIITFILISVVVLTFIIINERIKYEENNIFILKSLGYKKTYIVLKYLYKYLVTMLLSITLSFIIYKLFKNDLITLLYNSFNLPIYKYNNFNLKIYVIPFIIFIINYIYLFFKLKRNNRIKNNLLTKLISKINIKNKYTLSLSNTKLINVFILNLIVSTVLVISLNFTSYLNNIYNDSFKDINYKYMIKYNTYMLEDNLDYNVLYYHNKYYYDRLDICNKLNIPLSFNIKYSNNDIYDSTNIKDINKIESIININKLKENIKIEITNNNIIIYIIIFTLIINFIFILLTIFKILIDSNKKNIYLLNVLGYKNITINLFIPYLFSILISFIISVYLSEILLKDIDINICNNNYIITFALIIFIYLISIIIINKKIGNKPI